MWLKRSPVTGVGPVSLDEVAGRRWFILSVTSSSSALDGACPEDQLLLSLSYGWHRRLLACTALCRQLGLARLALQGATCSASRTHYYE